MRKLVLIIFLSVLILLSIAGYYLISPAFVTVEANDESPLIIRDSMLTMTEEEKVKFKSETDSVSDRILEMSDMMPSAAQIISQSDFKPRAHEVEGKAILIETNGEKILRFEDFETINGPNLHIYLSSELGDSDFIDLGKIKATKGNINYDIPSDIDTEKYNKVLVWCVPFNVLFSYADL